MDPIRLRSDGTLSLYEVMKYKYLGKGWAVEYADSEGNYGMGDPLSGAERLLWEDEGDAPVQADLEKEKPLILRLLKLTPENPQVLRLGVQVAGILKDKNMSDNVLELMSKYNQDALPLAKKFIENAFKSNQ